MKITEKDLELSRQEILGYINDALECDDVDKMESYIKDIEGSLENLKATAKQVEEDNKQVAEFKKQLDRLYIETVNLCFNV